MSENKDAARPRIVTDAAEQRMTSGAGHVDIDADRFDRQKRIGQWDQAAIEKQNVLVIGAGALGNEVCKLLFQLGVGSVHIVDFDTVIDANLNRCLFFDAHDVQNKALKADVITRKAKADYPHTKVVADTRKVEDLEEKIFHQATAVFGCLDNLGARLHVNAQSYGRAPVFDGGTTGFFGKLQVVAAPSACIECAMSERDYGLLWKRYSCVGEVLDLIDPKAPAIATTTSIVAAMQVNEFIKHAFGQPVAAGKYVHYDGLTYAMKTFDVPKRKNCPVHG